MYDLLGRQTGRSDAEMRLWAIEQARSRKMAWLWPGIVGFITGVSIVLFLGAMFLS